MIVETNYGPKIKCDECGKFVRHNQLSTQVIPDTYFTSEKLLQFHIKCNPNIENKVQEKSDIFV